MATQHGVYVNEKDTSLIVPVNADNAIQFVVGTAPVNLLKEPSKAVNELILANSYYEAVTKLGYSKDFKNYTLCQSISASFQVFSVKPIIFVNVLDPKIHKKRVSSVEVNFTDNECRINQFGILLDSIVIKSDDGSSYISDTDYIAAFDDDGYVLINIFNGALTATAEYDVLAPEMVDVDDIVGGYNAITGRYKGIELITQVYPKLTLIPGMLLAPGWSHYSEVMAALVAKAGDINGIFKAIVLADADSLKAATYDTVKKWKDDNGYVDTQLILFWPKVQVGTNVYYMSALAAALIGNTDTLNENVPSVSPSNKPFRISGLTLDNGSEASIDKLQADYLNGCGIVTAINLNGWRLWGNSTTVYPAVSDPKERFIPIRRMFNWWANTFILTYFQKVDSRLDKRLIESIVDSENLRAKGYVARGHIAGAKIEYIPDENPITDLMGGIIRFRQYLTPYPPAETIINTLEFSPETLQEALYGGE